MMEAAMPPRKPFKYASLPELDKSTAKEGDRAWVGGFLFRRDKEEWVRIRPATGEALEKLSTLLRT